MDSIQQLDDTRGRIVALRENLLDMDIVVDDRRHDLERAIGAVRAAVQQRDAIARQLAEAVVEEAS